MKSETSFRVFFLKEHRKNSLKNIYFPSESVFLHFSFWPQGHRSTQNAHCALGHPKQFLESIVCSLGYFNRDIFTSRSQIADYLWGQTFCPIKYYIYKEFLYILVSIQPFMFHNHYKNTMPIWVEYSTVVLMSHYPKFSRSILLKCLFHLMDVMGWRYPPPLIYNQDALTLLKWELHPFPSPQIAL